MPVISSLICISLYIDMYASLSFDIYHTLHLTTCRPSPPLNLSFFLSTNPVIVHPCLLFILSLLLRLFMYPSSYLSISISLFLFVYFSIFISLRSCQYIRFDLSQTSFFYFYLSILSAYHLCVSTFIYIFQYHSLSRSPSLFLRISALTCYGYLLYFLHLPLQNANLPFTPWPGIKRKEY